MLSTVTTRINLIWSVHTHETESAVAPGPYLLKSENLVPESNHESERNTLKVCTEMHESVHKEREKRMFTFER